MGADNNNNNLAPLLTIKTGQIMKLLSTLLLSALAMSAIGCQSGAKISVGADEPDLLKVQHEGFTLWIDCKKRSAVRFEYEATEDTGNHQRLSRFSVDPTVPTSCQQLSTATYKTLTENKYDRGHLYPANLADSSAESTRQSNYMTNVLPMAATMNRGAWLLTEEIVECYREEGTLMVSGGALWENDMPDSFETHGLGAIPSHYWKAVYDENKAIAWIIPNDATAKRSKIKEYIVSIDEIERRTGATVEAPPHLKASKALASWPIPSGCDRS